MGAAVLESMNGAVLVAGDHHRHVAEIGEPERVRRRQLGLQAQEGPGIAAEDALLLLRIDIAVGVEPIGNAGEAFRRPRAPARMDVHDADQSSLTPAALTTPPQRSTSSRMKRADACGVLPTGSADNSSRRLATSGDRIASAMSALIFSTTARGVLGGATTANHAEEAKPGSVSAMVGRSGSAAMRICVPTASSRNWPLFTSGKEVPRLSNITSQSPASMPCSAGAEPR